jgi:choice-of-anchor A domain-containing protein
MRQRYSLAIAALIGIGATLSGPASAALVGDAAAYNVFIFGNGTFTSQNTDTMGDLAAGGNVSLSSYQVAQGIAGTNASPNPARLVVGGKLTASNGSVGSNGAGSIYTNSTPSLTSFTATGGVHAQTLISSFSADATQYTNLSTLISDQATNGTTSGLLAGNTLNFSGTASGLNIFTVSGATLSSSQTINISAPSGSTVLINVTGASASFSNGSVNDSSVGAGHVLWNFYQSTSVNLVGSKDPEGSILAPLAGVTGGFGALHGQLVADSYSGNTQFDSTPFTGSLPVPLPAGAWLLLSGLGALGGATRRRLCART